MLTLGKNGINKAINQVTLHNISKENIRKSFNTGQKIAWSTAKLF